MPIKRDLTQRILLYSLLATFAVTLLLTCNTLMVMNGLWKYGFGTVLQMILLLLPSTLAVTVPTGLLFGLVVAYLQGPSGMTAAEIKPGIAVSASVFVLLLIFNNYVLPASNLKYKQVYYSVVGTDKQQGELKGTREMTAEELRQEIKKGDAGRHDPNWLKTELHKKFSIPVMALVFALIGIPCGIALGRISGGNKPVISAIRYTAAFLAFIVIIFICYVLLSIFSSYCYRGTVAPWLVWMPDIIVLAGAMPVWLLVYFTE